MPVPDNALAAVVALQIGGRGQKLEHFRFDHLGKSGGEPTARDQKGKTRHEG